MVGRLELQDDFKEQAEWDFHLKKKFQRSTSLLLAGSKGPDGPGARPRTRPTCP
jgi:hypothetical protein